MSRRRPGAEARKLAWADEQQTDEPHHGLAVDTSDGVRSSVAGSSSMSRQSSSQGELPYAYTYVVTAREVRKVHGLLARAGVVKPPAPVSATSTGTATPNMPSNPTTPGGSLPPRSPFVPLSAIKSSTSSSSSRNRQASGEHSTTPGRRYSRWDSDEIAAAEVPFVAPPQPSLRRALRTALDDDVLPVSSRAALRALAAGYSIHAVLNAILPALTRRKTGSEIAKSLRSGAAARTALAFGLFSFLYRVYSYLLTYVRLKILASCPGDEEARTTYLRKFFYRLGRIVRGNGIVPFFSVVLASPLLTLLPSQTPSKAGGATFPRKTLALDLFTKGLHAHYDILHRRRSAAVTWIPDWCDSALLYAIGQGQLLWAFLFEPDCFPRGYGDFILSRSSAYVPQRPTGLPKSVAWPSNRQIADHVALLSTPTPSHKPYPSFSSPVLSALTPSEHPTTPFATINPVLDWSPAHPAHSRLLCAMLHPNEPSCKTNYLNFWVREWKQTAKFVAFFTAVLNIFKWRAWKKDPEGSLFRLALNVAQGATVISGNIATAWGFTCLSQHYLSPSVLPRARYFFNGFLSSVFIYAVPAARRVQLGLYVARLSMDSTWQILAKKRKVRSSRYGDVALLALGIAMLAALYEDMPYTQSGYVRRIMGLILGPRLAGTASSTAGLPDAPPSSSTSQGVNTTNASNPAEFAAQLDSRIRNKASQTMQRQSSR